MPRGHTVVSHRGPAKVRKTAPGEIALRIILSAPGMEVEDVVAYVRDAINSASGEFAGDDPARNIKIVRILQRAWVEVVPTDATDESDNE
jgi:hypothetical protein